MSAADFNAAVAYVRSLPKGGSVQLDTRTKLEFYSLYKQATEGDVKGSQPWAVQIEARAKWDAWNGRKGMSSDAAKAAYVKRLLAVLKSRGVQWKAPAKTQSKL
ncbi:Acyl CoA binding protein [Novymonas esmeraldas]|uniref:Acyl CoA binding protein n=1 Tax=Novymonas esmeraldas TaxID=1808958 RepID=A0AAW0EP53_9TRYP